MNDSFFSCPHCGDEVAIGAKACPHCGSSDADGWRDDTDGFAQDDADDDFDYDEFVADEFSDERIITSKLKTWQVIVILVVLGSFAMLMF